MDAPSGDAREALRSATHGRHAQIEEMLTAAASAQPAGVEPLHHRELADAFLAATSRHLAAVDDVLLPAARKNLPGGRELAADCVRQARELEQELHAVKASLYGDANLRYQHREELWADARRLLAEHEPHDRDLVDRLEDRLSDEQMLDLAGRLAHREETAPSRPHPYTPHTGVLGRLFHRVWSVIDGFWDSAENRSVPHKEPGPHPRRNSLLTRYLLGAPRFSERGRQGPGERG